MKKQKAALILSFICCGLGQIYKGQKLKGTSFIIVYGLLIIFLLFYSSFSSLVRFLILSIVILTWLMGILDAYIDGETEGKHFILWQKVLNVLEIAVNAGAFAAIIVVSYPGVEEKPAVYASHSHKVEEKASNSSGTEFFSVQIGAFKNYKSAQELCNKLLTRGYSARTEYAASPGEGWYRVLVGRFDAEQAAISFAEKFHKNEGISYIIVSRPYTRLQ